MKIELLYGLLPVIFFPLTAIALAIISRKIGSLVVSFYRQMILFIVGVPIVFLEHSFFERVILNIEAILLTGIFGSVYLFSVFKSCDYLEVNQSRVLNIVWRILLSVWVWLYLLSENITIERTIWIAILLVGILWYLFVKNENTVPKYNLWLWVIINMVSSITFIWSQYYLQQYSSNFSGIESAYLLEIGSLPFLLLFIVLLWKIKELQKVKYLSKLDKNILLFGSIGVMIWSYGLALS